MSTLALNSPELQTKLFGLGVESESEPPKASTITELSRTIIDLCIEAGTDKERGFNGSRLVRFLGRRASSGIALIYDRRHDTQELLEQQTFVNVHGLDRELYILDEEVEGVKPGRYLKVDDLKITTSHEAEVVRSLVDLETKETVLKVARPANEADLEVVAGEIEEMYAQHRIAQQTEEQIAA